MTQTWVSSFHRANAQVVSRPTIATLNPLPQGFTGTAYSTPLSGFGGQGGYTWVVLGSTGLNSWGISGQNLISIGAPTSAENSTVTVGMTDAVGNPAPNVTFMIPVAGVLTPLWPVPLPNGQVGVPYSFTLTAANGVPSYRFFVASGVLPAGLSLNQTTGAISGTPTAPVNMAAVTFGVIDSSPAPTSTQVIAQNPPAANSGAFINTSDLGLLQCDGTRWLVNSIAGLGPPVPAGAAALGYNTCKWAVLPVVADITFTRVAPIPLTFLYSGNGPSSLNPPPTSYTTAPSGQLRVIFPAGGPANQAGYLQTQNVLNSQPSFANNQGLLPYLLAGNGFYIEYAATYSNNNSDNFNSGFVNPQEHNTIQLDHKPGDPTTPQIYERWMELDINESGHGTDQSGALRGGTIGWEGFFAGAFTLTAIPAIGSTGGTLTTPWTGSNGTVWPVRFGDGVLHNNPGATLTNGQTAVSWPSSFITTAQPNANITIGYARLFLNSNVVLTPLDYTVEHIFGIRYDPVGKTVAYYLDGVQQHIVSTATIDPISNSWHYFFIFEMASHGLLTGSTGDLRYFGAWTP